MDGNRIMVSVYCLVYNHEKYVGQALESFVGQKTNFRFEVIVHDDASTDSSAQIISQYAEKYPEIIRPIYQKENQYSQGKKIYRSYISPLIRGKYIASCEGDDFWIDENKLQIQVDFLEGHKEYSACVHSVECWNYINNKQYLMYRHSGDTDIPLEKIITKMQWQTSSVMYRKECDGNRPDFFDKSKYCGDYPLAIHLALKGKVRYIDRAMSVHRNGVEGSWTQWFYSSMESRIRQFGSEKEMLQAVNEYTDYQYKELIDGIIAEKEYCIEEWSGHYPVLKKEPYCRIYRSKPFSYKVKIFIKQYFNWLYQFYIKKHYTIKEPKEVSRNNF